MRGLLGCSAIDDWQTLICKTSAPDEKFPYAQRESSGLVFPQGGVLFFKLGNARLEIKQDRFDIAGIDLLRDMLRAVYVPGLDLEQDGLFWPCRITIRHEARSRASSSATTLARPQIFTRLRCA